eukprot:TRINITY_DN1699_c2_g3_i1.p2 TRINITY_DN1699_c2_g3~~TRINITY_DN1699_c2_g3_i1.p2  ORF type:complete len:124 (-),score=38.67 TRINITY_DN1699_c2_g3_i1:423-794(-)
MSSMFQLAMAFNGDVSGWDVSKVTDMYYMFQLAMAFNGNVSAWDVSNVTDMTNMFAGVVLATATYDALLNTWLALPPKSGVTFHGGNTKFSGAGKAARDALYTTYSWSITDICGLSGIVLACG